MLKLKFVLCAAALLMLSPAHAQEPVDAAKAKAEGKVSWYTSTPIEHSQRIVALFRQQTGTRSSFSAPAVPPFSAASSRK